MKNLTELVVEGEYQLPFRPSKKIKKRQAPGHRWFIYAIYCIDWDMPIGTPILAARDGRVVETESRFNSHGGEKYINKANYVVIKHDKNESSVYAHLRRRGLKVRKGQKVKAGQVIGYSGQTGFAEYPHLHFGVYKNWRSTKEINIRVDLK